MKDQWVTYGITESGDNIPIVIWNKKPTDKQINKWYREWSPDDAGFISWQLDEVEYGDS